MPDARGQRIAENEVRFREINERLEQDLRRLPPGPEPLAFVCECGRADCAEPVHITVDEYERVRQDPVTFAIVPGHEFPDVETVIARTDRYAVVRKDPPAQPYAEAHDPRSGG